ncbi:MAG: carboxypeptidase-like regulatory domain-containing protein [Melioribacteraceae bacterium]
MKTKLFFIFSFLILFNSNVFPGTTGKISGRVIDAESGLPLPGANVIVEGTTIGAATDFDGYFSIINLSPNTYSLKISMIGFAPKKVTNILVRTDLTSKVNVQLSTESFTSEEVVVVAETPVVIMDLAGSHQTISGKDIESLPVTSVGEVLELQAGVEANFQVRGSSQGEILFRVDGISMRDGRSNQPITDIPLSAVQEISVQKGGFSAEYNNVRAGVVNVVSKEGSAEKYSGTLTFKIKPPTPKHFDISPYDADSYWLKPYLDNEVAWTGTNNGSWDEYKKRQFPQFDGWNSFSQKLLQDDDPTNDLTPEAAQKVFMWEHRKQGDITQPDYYIDGGFGGPVPFISKALGNLRFYTSFKREKDMYLMQLSRDAFINQSIMTRITAELKPSMKLTFMGLYGEILATNANRTGNTSFLSSAWGVANTINTSSFTVPWRIFTNDYYAPTSRFSTTLSAKLTHVLDPETFYEVQLLRVGRKYHTSPGRNRNSDKVNEIFDGYFLDEAPFGFERDALFSIEGTLGMGGAVSTSRDFSETTTYSARVDFVNQFDRHNQIKAGAEISYEDLQLEFGSVNYFLPEGNIWTSINREPIKGTVYFQDKIEFEGWISNIGLIGEYSDPNGNWFSAGLYDREFFSQDYDPNLEADFKNVKADALFTLSPRISVSHPITEDSKLYFNYGHYRQLQTSENLYRIQRDNNNKLARIGEPSLPLAKTVAYELGFDQAIANEYLVRVSAYYKDITDQELYARFVSFDDKVNYRKLTNNSYEDIFGVEVDLTKMRGKWITGNINFEYRVGTSGFFGNLENYENPALQRDYLRDNPVQNKPRPRPLLKSYIDIHTPTDFGPKIFDQNLFADWHFTFISRWRAGAWTTWNPNNLPGISFNVQNKSFYNVDLKITKVFPFGDLDLKLFADFSNLLNVRHFSYLSYRDIHDKNFYMQSLHLPDDVAGDLGYNNIAGDDSPGDYRHPDVKFVPIEWINTTEELPSTFVASSRAIYYEGSTERYLQFINEEWQEVAQSKMDQILEDKAYIDMPNQTFFTFLNPRNVFFGITLNYRF